MPLGSIMNLARTLWVPRDLALAARPIAEGKLLAIDMGRVGERFFLEAAGVGLDAGLFGPFERPAEGGEDAEGVALGGPLRPRLVAQRAQGVGAGLAVSRLCAHRRAPSRTRRLSRTRRSRGHLTARDPGGLRGAE
jgi:hypothetical protein